MDQLFRLNSVQIASGCCYVARVPAMQVLDSHFTETALTHNIAKFEHQPRRHFRCVGAVAGVIRIIVASGCGESPVLVGRVDDPIHL